MCLYHWMCSRPVGVAGTGSPTPPTTAAHTTFDAGGPQGCIVQALVLGLEFTSTIFGIDLRKRVVFEWRDN